MTVTSLKNSDACSLLLSLPFLFQLDVICCSFSHTMLPKTKKILYMTLVRSHLVYGSPIWRPHLIKDIISLENIQQRTTKFILNDFTSDYKTRLTNLNILPLMYQFELADILFFIKSVKHPTASFNMYHLPLHLPEFLHTHCKSSLSRNFYFARLPSLWNSLPPINLSPDTIKHHLKSHFWSIFNSNFNPDSPCTFHTLCPCHKCSSIPHPPNFNSCYGSQ